MTNKITNISQVGPTPLQTIGKVTPMPGKKENHQPSIWKLFTLHCMHLWWGVCVEANKVYTARLLTYPLESPVLLYINPAVWNRL